MEAIMQEQVLLAAIRKAFGGKNFDTASITGEAACRPELMASIEAAIPDCRWRSRSRRLLTDGGLRSKILQPVFERLAKQHFTTDRYGWWYLKEETPND